MFENLWHRKEKPLQGMMGGGGGVGGRLQGGAGLVQREMSILLWGAHGVPGRGGAPGGAGFVRVDGLIPVGSKVSYIIGSQYSGAGNYPGGNYWAGYFWVGGSAGGSPTGRASGGFSAAFIGGAPTVSTGSAPQALGVAGGSGGGGNDGFGEAWGGAGGGTTALGAAEDPPGNMAGGGGGPTSGGSGGSPNGNAGAQWAGGAGRPGHTDTGGGGGGWYGGGGGGSTGGYEAGGGGGSGYVAPPGATISAPDASSFEVTPIPGAPGSGDPVNNRGTQTTSG